MIDPSDAALGRATEETKTPAESNFARRIALESEITSQILPPESIAIARPWGPSPEPELPPQVEYKGGVESRPWPEAKVVAEILCWPVSVRSAPSRLITWM